MFRTALYRATLALVRQRPWRRFKIQKTKPHLIGLQEVSTRRQFQGDFLVGNPMPAVPAEDAFFDHLDLLIAGLLERSLDYRRVSAIQNADVELPGFAGCWSVKKSKYSLGALALGTYAAWCNALTP